MEIKKQDIEIALHGICLNGILTIPEHAKGMVIFAHGSGSSRFSTRNQYVAGIFNNANMATLLFDLLTPEEESVDAITREHRFNIELLSARLVEVTDWVLEQPGLQSCKIGYFGSSTGAAAALQAAAQRKAAVNAVVSRGGRPDLAGHALSQVAAPTLLIVGGHDEPVIEMNQAAMEQMQCEIKLEIVQGATHLFEEPGTLDEAAKLASEWFSDYLR